MAGRRDGGADPSGAAHGAEGLDRLVRPAQDDAAVAEGLDDRSVALPALRRPLTAALL